MTTSENQIEQELISTLRDLKYTYRPDIRDRQALEANFRKKFNELNRVTLTDNEFQRVLDSVVSADVFKAAQTLRTVTAFTRDDGTPLNFMLVNIKDWCKNSFEVINQFRINTDNSHHRYDVILLINGVPVVQIELKTLQVSPRRAMQQIVDYKNDAGNGYTKTLLCFVQLFIVSNRSTTWYFANNNSRHFSFSADERFLPVYQFADMDNKKISQLDDFAEAFLSKCVLSEMVMTGRMDIAFIYDAGPLNGVDFEPLLTEDLFLVAPSSSVAHIADSDVVTLEELAGMDLMLPTRINTVRKLVDTTFKRVGATPRLIAEIESVATMIGAIQANIGATILPWSAASAVSAGNDNICIRRVTKPTMPVKVSLCTSSQLPLSEPAIAVCDILVALAHGLAENHGTKIMGERKKDT